MEAEVAEPPWVQETLLNAQQKMDFGEVHQDKAHLDAAAVDDHLMTNVSNQQLEFISIQQFITQ